MPVTAMSFRSGTRIAKFLAAVGMANVALLGCDAHNAHRRESTAVCNHASTRARGIDVGEEIGIPIRYMRMIRRVRAWPMPHEAAYRAEDWQQLIRVARMLQRGDSSDVEIALERYTRHFETAFEEGTDTQAEWSKCVLLISVMFEIPEDAARNPSISDGLGGFGSVALAGESGLAPTLPIRWSRGGPAFAALRGAYNGSRYEAEQEYAYCREHYKPRAL